MGLLLNINGKCLHVFEFMSKKIASLSWEVDFK